jgi:hypothetical protein
MAVANSSRFFPGQVDLNWPFRRLLRCLFAAFCLFQLGLIGPQVCLALATAGAAESQLDETEIESILGQVASPRKGIPWTRFESIDSHHSDPSAEESATRRIVVVGHRLHNHLLAPLRL